MPHRVRRERATGRMRSYAVGVTVASVAAERFARWCAELDSYGYEIESSGGLAAAPGEVVVRAHRPTTYGGPTVLIDIRELWLAGQDPDGLGLSGRGCHLHVSAWHAQLTGQGAIGAERLDVDRRKAESLMVHRHPVGEPNDVRVSAVPLVAPERWLEEIELLIFTMST